MEGIVTLSDVTETIAGNLPNKWKRSTPAMIFRRMRTVPGREWSYATGRSGAICAAAAGREREYHTIAGLLMEYLQRIPKLAKKFRWGIICLKRCRWKAMRAEGADYSAA